MVPPRAHAEPRHMCRLCPAGQDPRHRWPMPRLRATDCCRCSDCGQAYRAGLTRTGDSWTCRRCALRRAVDQVLPAESSGTLYLLRTAILQAEQLTTRRWITRPEIAFLLRDLAAGRTPLTHESLDAQPAHTGIERLRDLLVAASALPADHTRTITRFELDAQRMLTGLLPTDARLVRSWLRWAVLPHVTIVPSHTRSQRRWRHPRGRPAVPTSWHRARSVPRTWHWCYFPWHGTAAGGSAERRPHRHRLPRPGMSSSGVVMVDGGDPAALGRRRGGPGSVVIDGHRHADPLSLCPAGRHAGRARGCFCGHGGLRRVRRSTASTTGGSGIG